MRKVTPHVDASPGSGMAEYIPLTECRHRHLYRLNSRNLTLGVYNEATKGFIGIREKFGSRFLFTEFHWDTGPPYGTAYPLADLGEIPRDVEAREEDATGRDNRRVEWRPDEPEGLRGKWYYLDTGEPMAESEFPVRLPYQPLFELLDQIEKEAERKGEVNTRRRISRFS